MKTHGMQNLHLQNQRIEMDNRRMKDALAAIHANILRGVPLRELEVFVRLLCSGQDVGHAARMAEQPYEYSEDRNA